MNFFSPFNKINLIYCSKSKKHTNTVRGGIMGLFWYYCWRYERKRWEKVVLERYVVKSNNFCLKCQWKCSVFFLSPPSVKNGRESPKTDWMKGWNAKIKRFLYLSALTQKRRLSKDMPSLIKVNIIMKISSFLPWKIFLNYQHNNNKKGEKIIA